MIPMGKKKKKARWEFLSYCAWEFRSNFRGGKVTFPPHRNSEAGTKRALYAFKALADGYVHVSSNDLVGPKNKEEKPS